MMKPEDDEGRFTKIFYFKENPETSIPKWANLTGNKKQIYGYGFTKKIKPLSPEILPLQPSYLPYDPYSNKLSIRNYEKLKRDSLVRVEAQDFADYKSNRTKIFIADHDFFYIHNALDFLEEYKNKHTFDFFWKLVAKDEETYNKFNRYTNLINRRIIVDFNFNKDFFIKNYSDNTIFTLKQNNSFEEYLIFIIQIILYYKSNNLYPEIITEKDRVPPLDKIMQWGRNPTQESFVNYYKNDTAAQQFLNKAKSDIRLLLKTNPKNFKNSDIDFLN